MSAEETKQKIREIVFSKYVTGVDPATITNDQGLISGGWLDSINVLRLVDHLEKEFNVEFKSHEVDKDNLNSIDLMSAIIEKKRSV